MPNRPALPLLAALALTALGPTARAQRLTPTDLYGAGRCAAYLDAFDAGLATYRAGATDLARRAWTDAAETTTCGPDAAYNLAILASETGDLRRAAVRFGETLDRLRGWPVPDSARPAVRAMRQLALAGLFNVGVIQLDRDSLAAADATLGALLVQDPLYRDAWYNRAVGLLRAQRWADLDDAAARLLAFDPLSRTAHTLRFEAQRGLGQTRAAARTLRARTALPLDVARLDIVMGGDTARVTGTVRAGASAARTTVRLALTLLTPDGPLGTQTVVAVAPADGAETTFAAVFPHATGATAYRYRKID